MTKEHVDVWDWRFLKFSDENFRAAERLLLEQITAPKHCDCRSIGFPQCITAERQAAIDAWKAEGRKWGSEPISEPSPTEKQNRGFDWIGRNYIDKSGEIIKACYFCGLRCICPQGGYGIVPDSK